MKYSIIYLIIAFVITTISCKDSKEKVPTVAALVKEKKAINNVEPISQKGPIINIIDTIEIKRTVLCIKDSAANMERMDEKLSNIFNKKLPDAILLGKLKIIGAPIVWYKSKKAPYFFEAGIPVDKAPAKLGKGIFINKTGEDSAFVAHFFGPTKLSAIGYEALTEMLKDNNKKKSTASYEIYVGNKFLPANEKTDPYKLQTDIVMPYRK